MKRIIGVLTTLLLAVGVLAVPTTAQAVTAPTMTQSQLTTDVGGFVGKYQGDYIDFDGVYGAQCVDLLKEWLQYEYGVTVGAMGNAEAWWNRYSSNSVLKSLFTQVSKTATPQPGWIAVYHGGYADATAGHIALVTGANYTATTSVYGSNLYMNRVFQQNAPKLGQASNSSYFPVASLLGYLAPKNVTAAVVGATAKLVDTGWSRSTPTKTVNGSTCGPRCARTGREWRSRNGRAVNGSPSRAWSPQATGMRKPVPGCEKEHRSGSSPTPRNLLTAARSRQSDRRK